MEQKHPALMQNNLEVTQHGMKLAQDLGLRNEMELLEHLHETLENIPEVQQVYQSLVRGMLDSDTLRCMEKLNLHERKVLLSCLDSLAMLKKRIGFCTEVRPLVLRLVEASDLVQRKRITLMRDQEWKA